MVGRGYCYNNFSTMQMHKEEMNYLEYPACLIICQKRWTHEMVQQVETLPGKPSDPSSVSTTHTIHTPVYLYSDLAITCALHTPEYSLTASLLFPVMLCILLTGPPFFPPSIFGHRISILFLSHCPITLLHTVGRLTVKSANKEGGIMGKINHY